MKVDICIPDGKSGIWEIETKTVTKQEADFGRLRALMRDGRFTPEGIYKGLLRGGSLIMSNTPDEIHDHYPFYRNAKDHVLINGLGLGVCIQMVLEKVDQITVIEKSKDVINLVFPYYKDNSKVNIIHCDAYEYQPPKKIRYGAVWHDIWDDICTDNLPEMTRLHRKYGRKTDWQGSWMKSYLESM